MKIAICFYGLVGSKVDKNGSGSNLDPSIAYNLNYNNLILGNDVDVFIHSWSSECKEQLLEYYQPKLFIIEDQKEFPLSDKLKNNRDLKEKIKNIISVLNKKRTLNNIDINNKKEAFRACSRWYSNKKVLELKRQYEIENRFKYDCVMVLRLDVGFYSKMDFSEYDMGCFYASNWNDYPNISNDYKVNRKNHNLGKGFLDFWFLSNSDNMDSFSKLYDNMPNYHICPHRASYEHTITFTNNIRYTKYRWFDFEMIRRKEYNSEI